MYKTILALLCFLGSLQATWGQDHDVSYLIGEKYGDRHKYSNLLSIDGDGSGGTLVVRAYYQGIVLRPKGYLIERYDANLQLINEHNYKLKDANFIEAFVRNGQVHLLFLVYDYDTMAYTYVVHRSPFDGEFAFTQEALLSIPSEPVQQPLDRNFYNRDFSKGFTTSVLFSKDKDAFAITTHFKRGKVNAHYIHVFDTRLKKLMEHDFSDAVEEKNYAFEHIAFSEDLKQVYLSGKAYFKKKRFNVTERKFQYELVRISASDRATQSFYVPGKFPEAIKPIFKDDRLYCLGFYADRKDNRYNGIAYYRLDHKNLTIHSERFNPFSTQFMTDKFGREDDKAIKNLVFKGMHFTDDGHILFNAEEYFTTRSTQSNSSGGRVMVTRYHHNDIVSVKMDMEGRLIWARNINKTEVTQGDDAYASYTPYTKDGITYFFISTSAEQPQQITGQRIMFKQGYSRNRNVFMITLDEKGDMGYKKLIDNEAARLPLMVAKPLVDPQAHELLFYAKRGNKKQLVTVEVN